MGIFDRKPSATKTQVNNEASRLTKLEEDAVKKSLAKGRSWSASSNSAGLNINSNKDQSLEDSSTRLQEKKVLKRVSNNPIVQSIIRTRGAQLSKYSRPASWNPEGVGFKLVPKKLSKDGKLNERQKREIAQLEEFIFNTGYFKPGESEGRDTFPTFLTSYLENKYVYDQINVERIFKNKNSNVLDHFNMVDAGTIVHAKTPKTSDDKRQFAQYTSTIESKPILFSEKELTFVTSYHNSVDNKGYGFSEVQASLRLLNAEDNTEQFNSRFFSQGGTTRGVLVIDSNGNQQQSASAMQSLKRDWQSSASGLSGAWKIPVISSHDAKFVNMTQSSKDMEFERWLNYLINSICAIFQIQPDEINFPNRGGATGGSQSHSINEGNTQQSKMKQSQDKGLTPLLNEIENFVNRYILPFVNTEYRFQFTLGDVQNQLEQQKIIQLKGENGATFNELRTMNGLPNLNLPKSSTGIDLGDVPVTATGVQYFQSMYLTDADSQRGLQHKNDNNPDKAENGKPEEAGVKLQDDNSNNSETDENTQNQELNDN